MKSQFARPLSCVILSEPCPLWAALPLFLKQETLYLQGCVGIEGGHSREPRGCLVALEGASGPSCLLLQPQLPFSRGREGKARALGERVLGQGAPAWPSS